MPRKMIVGVTVALGFACASTQKPQPLQANAVATDGTAVVSNDPKRRVVCTYETLVGSHIPSKSCRYQDEVEAQRAETQQMLRNYKPPNLRTGD
ncbi:MAG TPA: hypothetical protein VII08_09355 [Myxococcales bacterium]